MIVSGRKIVYMIELDIDVGL